MVHGARRGRQLFELLVMEVEIGGQSMDGVHDDFEVVAYGSLILAVQVPAVMETVTRLRSMNEHCALERNVGDRQQEQDRQ